MKTFLRKLVEEYLAFLAKIYLRRHKPVIIGITGSLGKTSVKEAIYFLLKQKFSAQAGEKSLNTEIGFPLSLLCLKSGFSSPLKWFSILLQAAFRGIFGKKMYEKFIAEYGADKPGDIEKLLKIAEPDVAVLTGIGKVHLEKDQFKDEEDIFKEKQKLISMPKNLQLAVINSEIRLDIQPLELQSQGSSAKQPRRLWYGIKEGDLFAKNIISDFSGLSGELCFSGKLFKFHFNVIGKHHIAIFMPALLVGMYFGIPLEEGIKLLRGFTLPPGRFSVIAGINNSTILDSSYNASPTAVKEALKTLHELSKHPATRRIAVLGNMNELGQYTETCHREIGKMIPDSCDFLVTVGNFAKFIAAEALKNGFNSNNIKTLNTSDEAGDYLRTIVKEGDLILFKGSQNLVRLEKAVKKIMKNPEDAEKLLARQEPEWQNI